MSAKSDVSPLLPHLENKLTLLVGQSGMGKSKTVNALVLSDVARVGDLTASRDSGAHTTTFSRFYRLDRDTAIIDTPGFQSFGLFHLTEDQIGEAMREFRPFLGSCKFNDCAHLNEPGCAVIAAGKRNEISRRALSFYQVLIEQHRDLHEQHPEWSVALAPIATGMRRRPNWRFASNASNRPGIRVPQSGHCRRR
jgi:ribosome biogenesis GTPase